MSSNTRDYPNPGAHWWLVLIEGIAAIILGVLLLARPLATISSIVVILGIYWLITGVATLISLMWNREQWGWKIITATFGIIAGLFIVRNPIISTFLVPASFGWALGIIGIVIGLSQIVQFFRGGSWGVGVLGLFSVILGFLLVTNPAIGGLSLALMLAILLIIGGAVALFAAFRLRGMSKDYEQAKLDDAQKAMASGSTAVASGSRAATNVATAAKAGVAGAATGAAGAAAAGVAATRQVSTDIGQGVAGAAAGVAGAAAGVAGAATAAGNVASNTWQDMGDATRGVYTEATGAASAAVDAVADAGNGVVDAVVDAGNGAVAAVDALFTGNVNPLDAEEMSKYKYPLEFIEGVGQASADKLRAIGVNNCLDLLKWGHTPKGRAEIAQKSGLPGRSILTWVNHIDLYRIKGVGSEYADLLEASGVDTVVELAQRNPGNLFDRLNAVNLEKNLVRKLPTQSQVLDWVNQAKGLPRVVNY